MDVLNFIFIFILPPVPRSAVKMSVNQIMKNKRPKFFFLHGKKIKYYKICDIKYGIRFLLHEAFCLKL